MAKKKEEKEKEYRYLLFTLCKECGTVALSCGPCVKCGGILFEREYKAVEKKENDTNN